MISVGQTAETDKPCQVSHWELPCLAPNGSPGHHNIPNTGIERHCPAVSLHMHWVYSHSTDDHQLPIKISKNERGISTEILAWLGDSHAGILTAQCWKHGKLRLVLGVFSSQTGIQISPRAEPCKHLPSVCTSLNNTFYVLVIYTLCCLTVYISCLLHLHPLSSPVNTLQNCNPSWQSIWDTENRIEEDLQTTFKKALLVSTEKNQNQVQKESKEKEILSKSINSTEGGGAESTTSIAERSVSIK